VSETTAMLLVHALEIYVLLGVVFALPFAVSWVGRIDPHAAAGTWGFRVVIVPGVIALWPLLASRLIRRRREPPDEWTAHRRRAGGPA
jgi:hypothetical protein